MARLTATLVSLCGIESQVGSVLVELDSGLGVPGLIIHFGRMNF